MADVSVISASTVVRGNLSGNTSLRIDGRVRGDVTVSGDLQLGSGAQVAGNISGASISIAGSVEGDISASVVLLLEKGAKVVGNLTAPRVGIAEGAFVRGDVQSDGATGETRPVALASNFGSRTTPTATRVVAPRVAERPPARPVPRVAPRVEVAPIVDKAPARKAPVAEALAATPQASLNLDLGRSASEATKVERKAPPPPVVSAPSRVAKGRKKVAKRS